MLVDVVQSAMHSETDKRHAVAEKEALAATWTCEKFIEYIVALHVMLEADHKPLIPLLKTTELAKMPPRIQQFRLRPMRYNPVVAYVPRKHQTTANTLPRAPVNFPEQADVTFVEEVEYYANHTVTVLPDLQATLAVAVAILGEQAPPRSSR